MSNSVRSSFSLSFNDLSAARLFSWKFQSYNDVLDKTAAGALNVLRMRVDMSG